METLAAMFELDLPTVHGIISKMIIGEELMVRAWRDFGLILGGFGAVLGLPCAPRRLPHPPRTRVTQFGAVRGGFGGVFGAGSRWFFGGLPHLRAPVRPRWTSPRPR